MLFYVFLLFLSLSYLFDSMINVGVLIHGIMNFSAILTRIAAANRNSWF